MASSRGAQKCDRVTVTLVPTTDDRSFRHGPSTFSSIHRSYEWRKAKSLSYMIVPKRISSVKIEVDVFVTGERKGKLPSKAVQKVVQDFMRERIESEWKGLKLGAIGRPTPAAPPQKALVRGSIEDILGVNFGR